MINSEDESEDFFTENDDSNDSERIVEGEDVENEEKSEKPVEGDQDSDGDKDKPEEKTKKIIRNPQPKLNAETLKTPRGLSAISSHFERVKFKGKGYEEQDLDVILKTYEYWCHRLFPKFPFEASIARIEKLGSKRVTINQVKRIRMDLDVEEIVTNLDQEEDDQMDALPPLIVPEDPVELTDEQLERMRVNRERAERLKREKLNKGQTRAQEISGESSSQSQVSQDLFGNTQGTQNDPHRTLIDNDEAENVTQFTPNVEKLPQKMIVSSDDEDDYVFTRLVSNPSKPGTSKNNHQEVQESEDSEMISQHSSKSIDSDGSKKSQTVTSKKRKRQILSSDDDDDVSSKSNRSESESNDLQSIELPQTQTSVSSRKSIDKDEINQGSINSSRIKRRQILSSDDENSSDSIKKNSREISQSLSVFSGTPTDENNARVSSSSPKMKRKNILLSSDDDNSSSSKSLEGDAKNLENIPVPPPETTQKEDELTSDEDIEDLLDKINASEVKSSEELDSSEKMPTSLLIEQKKPNENSSAASVNDEYFSKQIGDRGSACDEPKSTKEAPREKPSTEKDPDSEEDIEDLLDQINAEETDPISTP